MEMVKYKTWTKKSDALYFVRMPLEVIKTIPAILKGEPKINEMTWRDYISLAKSQADMKCGRLYYFPKTENNLKIYNSLNNSKNTMGEKE